LRISGLSERSLSPCVRATDKVMLNGGRIEAVLHIPATCPTEAEASLAKSR
jgi:hypothetical protein